jgi:hypothetical protein
MIDLVRASVLPTALVRSMARGAIALPPREVIEILVYLAIHNADVKEQARQTLEGWSQSQLKTVIADPKAPKEVVEYFAKIAKAQPMPKETAVQPNPVVIEPQPEIAEAALATDTSVDEQLKEVSEADATVPASDSDEGDAKVATFLKEHEHELATETEKPFQPLGGNYEEEAAPEPKVMVAAAGAGASAQSASSSVDGGKKAPDIKAHPAGEPDKRGGVLQKISRLDIKGRIQLALKGTKEERSILVRDAAKLVAFAVLESPKITDGEVEKIASQKNVLEAVLRQIPMKRRFAKNYIIVRNLVANPRTPLDVALGLMKNLLVNDLKNISGNKDVSDTIRKLALKMFKQKITSGK